VQIDKGTQVFFTKRISIRTDILQNPRFQALCADVLFCSVLIRFILPAGSEFQIWFCIVTVVRKVIAPPAEEEGTQSLMTGPSKIKLKG
jgi:hypothetical protein